MFRVEMLMLEIYSSITHLSLHIKKGKILIMRINRNFP